mmetsp:Transcript_7052/g.21391  ORF Transcript_7052/g.21391 Transcript_7052/m.21391 type:complete len:97 (-) Transcript_7052:136-426(-)
MFRSQFRCLSFLAAAATVCADGLGSQQRGSVAAAPATVPVQGHLSVLSQVQHTDCGCSQGACACVRSNSSQAESEEQEQLEQNLTSQTQVDDLLRI